MILQFDYSTVFEPLLKDLACLEENGLYIPSLGIYVKGTVFCVGTDNLGAHSLGGFVESFSSAYVCRFCLAEWSQIQVSDVRSGAFSQRTVQEHRVHVDTVKGDKNESHCYGVKKKLPTDRKPKTF